MKLYTSIFLAVILLAGSISSAATEPQDKEVKAAPESSYRKMVSPSGLIAHYFQFITEEGEGEGRVLIEKQGAVIATLTGVRPVSFSPTADILLVREDFGDDDLRHYLLDVGAGQYQRTEARNEYIFGSRYVSKATWSKDGKTIVLVNDPDATDEVPTIISVEKMVGKVK
jgi:hypothetical protein